MRTTLDIDDDVLAVARDLAKAERRSIGEVVSELMRLGLGAPSARDCAQPEVIDYDDASFPRFPDRGGPPVTPELIRRIQDELDVEDATPWDFETDKPRVFPKND